MKTKCPIARNDAKEALEEAQIQNLISCNNMPYLLTSHAVLGGGSHNADKGQVVQEVEQDVRE